MMRHDHRNRGAALLLLLLLALPMLVCHCNQRESVAGKYHALGRDRQAGTPVTLELNPDGKGLWSVETDNAPFRWDLRRNTIRLHTRSGGVIEGTIDKDTIRIALPGMDTILFERTP